MIDVIAGKDSSTGKYFFSEITRDRHDEIIDIGPEVHVADLGALTCVIKNKVLGTQWWSITSRLDEISEKQPLSHSELIKLTDGIAS